MHKHPAEYFIDELIANFLEQRLGHPDPAIELASRHDSQPGGSSLIQVLGGIWVPEDDYLD